MTEIIICLKRHNNWIITVQGSEKEKIAETFKSKVKRENTTTARLELTTYNLKNFIYWLKQQDFETKYTELF